MTEKTFGVIGDPHGAYVEVAKDIDYLLVTGDLGKPYMAEPLLEYFEHHDAPTYLVTGNHDVNDYGLVSNFQEHVDNYESVHNIDDSVIDIGEYELVGYGAHRFDLGPETLDEWEHDRGFTDDPASFSSRKEELHALLESSTKSTILLSHNVPFDSGVDTLDSPIARRVNRFGLPYGSDVINTVLQDDISENVLLNVAGHIHEGKGIGEVNDVPVINAGQADITYVTVEDGEILDIRD